MAGALDGARAAFRDMFPTTETVFIFVGYMALFINLGLLVTASKSADGTLAYNPVTVVLITETTKLVAAIVLHMRGEGVSLADTLDGVQRHRRLFVEYFVPAGLYAFYNVLTYYNLTVFDPTTYFMLLQMRVVVTGVVFQFLFKKALTPMQWLSLLILMLGCIIKQYDFSGPGLVFTPSLFLILVQVVCSCSAGVYNEFLLKGKTSAAGNVPTMLQNVYMYSDSILVNVVILTYKGELGGAFTGDALAALFDWRVIALICNNAAIGIVTSLFLKKLNSIVKTFASALELVFTAVLSWILFGIPINGQTVVAIMLIAVALYFYTLKPVINTTPQAPGADQKSSLTTVRST